MHKIIGKYWNIPQMNAELKETFQNNPFATFKRNKNLKEIIGDHMIKNRKVFLNPF